MSKNLNRIKYLKKEISLAVTLLVENNSEIENYYSLNLLTWLNLQSYWCQSSTETIEILLGKTFDVNLIIVRNTINEEPAAQVLIEFLMKEIEQTCKNSKLAGFEIPKKILLSYDQFTIDNGMLTVTMKAMRTNIRKIWESKVANLYNY